MNEIVYYRGIPYESYARTILVRMGKMRVSLLEQVGDSVVEQWELLVPLAEIPWVVDDPRVIDPRTVQEG